MVFNESGSDKALQGTFCIWPEGHFMLLPASFQVQPIRLHLHFFGYYWMLLCVSKYLWVWCCTVCNAPLFLRAHFVWQAI